MSKILTNLLIASLLVFVGCAENTDRPAVEVKAKVTPVSLKIDTPERLAAEYEKAFKAQDAEAVRALFCWEGVKGRSLGQQKQIAILTFGEGMKEIVIDEVPPSLAKKLKGVERNDKLLVPNIEVTKVLRVTHRNNSVGWIPIGKKDGQWVISSTVETELPEEEEIQ